MRETVIPFIKENKADYGISGSVTQSSVKNWLNDSNTSDEEIGALAVSCGYSEESAAPSNAIVMDGQETIETEAKDGTKVISLLLEFTGLSGNANFKFALGEATVIHSGDKLRRLHAAGGLNIGDKVPFKTDSIKPTKNAGFFYGVPNFSASDRLTAMVTYENEMDSSIKSFKAKLRVLNLTEDQITDRVIAKYGGAVEDSVVIPTMPSF